MMNIGMSILSYHLYNVTVGSNKCLSSRKMRVRAGSYFSKWEDVWSGVPQGSVLGPLLFLIFVNELPNWVVNDMLMFADDTKIWTSIQSHEDKKFFASLQSSSLVREMVFETQPREM